MASDSLPGFQTAFDGAAALARDRARASDAESAFEAVLAQHCQADSRDAAAVLLMLARCAIRLDKLDVALQRLEQCRELTLRLHTARSIAYADVMIVKSDALRRKRDFKEAMRAADKGSPATPGATRICRALTRTRAAEEVARAVAGEGHDLGRALLSIGTIMIDRGDSQVTHRRDDTITACVY